MIKSTELSIIIPAFNEARTIALLLRQFHSTFPHAHYVLIDNASTDQTGEIAEKTLKDLDANGVVLIEPRKGKGFAIRRAFDYVQAPFVAMVDADCTYSEKDLAALLVPVLNDEADMVVGNRFGRGAYQHINARRFHQFGNRLVKGVINGLFKSSLDDMMSGYRVLSKRFIKNFPSLATGFEIEVELTLHALDKQFRVKEIPITYQDRPDGSHSKLRTYHDGFRVIWFIFNVLKDYRPLMFFSFLAALIFCLGCIWGIPVVLEFIQSRFITKIPSAILASGLMIIAILFLASG